MADQFGAVGERESAMFAQRIAGALLLAGASLIGGLATLLRSTTTPVFAGTRDAVFAVCVVVGCLGLVFLLVRRLPSWLLRAAPPATAILICIPPAVAGASSAAGQLLLVWPMLFAAYLLPRRTIATSSADWPDPITVSIGVATLPDHAITGSTLQAASDAALYAAKAAGRDRVTLSTASAC